MLWVHQDIKRLVIDGRILGASTLLRLDSCDNPQTSPADLGVNDFPNIVWIMCTWHTIKEGRHQSQYGGERHAGNQRGGAQKKHQALHGCR
jgi:hypothetical protein